MAQVPDNLALSNQAARQVVRELLQEEDQHHKVDRESQVLLVTKWGNSQQFHSSSYLHLQPVELLLGSRDVQNWPETLLGPGG